MSGERRVEMTSSQKLFDPEGFLYITGRINRNRPPDAQVGLEFYPVVRKLPPLHKVPYIRNRRFVKDHLIAFEGDGRISLEQIHAWWTEHGYGQELPVRRIHLPFHYAIPLALKNYFWNSLIPLASPYEPGTGHDRAIASAVAWMTMTSMNLFATKLAGELGAGLNAHVNIVEEAAKRGKLDKVLGENETDVENDGDYVRSDSEQFEAERDPQRAFEVVEKYGLHGVIYGADHAFRAGKDPREKFEEHKKGFDKHLRVVHLSGSRGDHGLITDEDYTFWQFMDFLKDNVSADVSFCLDLDPFEMDHLTEAQQVDYLDNLTKKFASY